MLAPRVLQGEQGSGGQGSLPGYELSRRSLTSGAPEPGPTRRGRGRHRPSWPLQPLAGSRREGHGVDRCRRAQAGSSRSSASLPTRRGDPRKGMASEQGPLWSLPRVQLPLHPPGCPPDAASLQPPYKVHVSSAQGLGSGAGVPLLLLGRTPQGFGGSSISRARPG